MTFRSRPLLDLAHSAPCCLLLGAPGCGNNPSVPCHSDMQLHGRGVGHKSGDQFAVAGCPACHAVFTREHLGRDRYERAWVIAHERYQTWLWESGHLAVVKRPVTLVMSSDLSITQKAILSFIRKFTEQNGMSPTRVEIARAMQFKSTNAAQEHIEALAALGEIKVLRGAHRSIRLVDA